MRVATRKISAMYDAALAPLGINIAQYSLLRTIVKHQPLSLTDLGHRTDLDRSTVGRNIRVLERQGLIRCQPGGDRRATEVELSPDGNAMLTKALPLWETCQQTFADRLGKDGLDALNAALRAA